MGGSIFSIRDFHSHNGWRVTLAKVIIVIGISPVGDKLRWQRGVESVSQQRELELNLFLQLNGDGVSLLEKYGISPKVISQGGELVILPLAEGPCC